MAQPGQRILTKGSASTLLDYATRFRFLTIYNLGRFGSRSLRRREVFSAKFLLDFLRRQQPSRLRAAVKGEEAQKINFQHWATAYGQLILEAYFACRGQAFIRVYLPVAAMVRSVDDLHVAIRHGEIEQIKIAVKAPSLLRSQRCLRTALGLAVQYGKKEVVQLLLQNGADANQVSHDEFRLPLTPLVVACRSGKVEIARLLLENGASPDCTDCFGHSALWVATKARCRQLVQVLIEHSANLLACSSNWKNCPLYYAAKHAPHCGMAELLIYHGYWSNYEDEDGLDALGWSLQNGHMQLSLTMVQAGIPISKKHRQLFANAAATAALTVHQSLLLFSMERSDADLLCSLFERETLLPSLRSTARRVVRSACLRSTAGTTIQPVVMRLPLPKSLQRFLLRG
uniref:ANK_REP_REGION domain-containing protein n=1 Tax=Trichuris muris TaxID=70415 RepID=A0A5S6QCP6_TRIMR